MVSISGLYISPPHYPKVVTMRYRKNSAFTMIELILVIIIIGILAALAIPRINRDIRQELGDNILSAIRYTQHLALMDNMTDPTDSNWQKKYWHLRFGSYGNPSKFFYTISSDRDENANVDKVETAIDPANGKYFYHLAGDATLNESDESPNIFISKKYGISQITYTGGCNGGQLIAFDHLGRPHVGIYSGSNDFGTYMKQTCTMTFSFSDSSINPISITILPETGYAQIVGNDNS